MGRKILAAVTLLALILICYGHDNGSYEQIKPSAI